MPNKKLGRPVHNRYKVIPKKWNKWSNLAKRVFNDLYASMVGRNQWKFLHPKQPTLPKERWSTTSWNAAWVAADIVDGQGKLGHIIQDGKVYRTRPKHEGKPTRKKVKKAKRRAASR